MSDTQKKLKFSDRLRVIRQKRGLSRTKLAKKIGLTSPSQISRYESDKGVPNFHALQKIAEVLNIDLHWLITGDPSPELKRLVDGLRPYAMAYLSEVCLRLEKLHRERSELRIRTEQGENLRRAMKDVDALIKREDRYFQEAFHQIDNLLDIAVLRDEAGEALPVIRIPDEQRRLDEACDRAAKLIRRSSPPPP